MKRTLLFSIILFGLFSLIRAQDDMPVSYDFSGYNGNDKPDPAAGWGFTGFDNDANDIGRGSTSGGVTTGGLYSLNNGAIWIQSSSADFTPGTIDLTVCNNSGATVEDIFIDYEIPYLNDENRSTTIDFGYVINGVFTAVPGLAFSTPLAADALGIQTVSRSTSISGANIPNGDCITFFGMPQITEVLNQEMNSDWTT